MLKRHDALQQVGRSRRSSWPAALSDGCSRRGLAFLQRRCARAAPAPIPVVPNCGHRACIASALA
eukprot:6387053-Prymnesium_polylepis.1